MQRPTTYFPNCDNLAALLGSSIDDPLMRSSSFPIYSCVKPEPFEGYGEANFAPQPPLPDYATFCPTSSYTTMSAMAPISATSSGSNRSSPLLPICPVPTEKTVDNVFYAPKQTEMLTSCRASLQDPNLLSHLVHSKSNKTCDVFQFCKSVIEDNLNQLVNWAKNAPYFDKFHVSASFLEFSATQLKMRHFSCQLFVKPLLGKEIRMQITWLLKRLGTLAKATN